MRSLGRWQAVSFVSRGLAVGLGIFQTFFIIRILDVPEWGLVQLAVAIGGAFGIYQHLGLASATTREVAATTEKRDIFKIFLTSVVIRYVITIPIACFLFFGASGIALNQYNEPALVPLLQIYAVTLLVVSFQSMLNSVISGSKRFKALFIYQVVIACVSVALYIPLVYLYGVSGYFYAFFLFNVIATLTLLVLAFLPLKGNLEWPSRADFIRLFKALFAISLGVYVVKVLFTLWEKSGTILLGQDVSLEVLGLFSFGLLYAKKIMHISDAVTDVNLPVLSGKYASNIDEFKVIFSQNFNKVFAFMLFGAFSAVFWAPEVTSFIVGSNKYDTALPLILPLMFTFVFYGLINIIKSSVFIPAKLVRDMVIGFALMLTLTVAFYYGATSVFAIDYVLAMTGAMLLGVFVGFMYLTVSSQRKLKFKYMDHNHALILIQVFVIALASGIESPILKILSYVGFVGLYIWGLNIAKFVTWTDWRYFIGKLKSLTKRQAKV